MKFLSKKKSLLIAAAMGVSFVAAPLTPSYAAETPQSYTQQDLNDEMIMAVAWMQNSAEYRELCYQAYNTALERVKAAVQCSSRPGY